MREKHSGFISFFPIFIILLLVIGVSLGFFWKTGFISKQPPTWGDTTPKPYIDKDCKTGGCSGEICLNKEDSGPATTCEYRSEFYCYRSARCEKQASGECGWTQTDELNKCLSQYSEQKGAFCGGFAGVACPQGYTCKLDGNYPDAGGRCLKD